MARGRVGTATGNTPLRRAGPALEQLRRSEATGMAGGRGLRWRSRPLVPPPTHRAARVLQHRGAYLALESRWNEAAVHGNEGAADVGLRDREGAVSGPAAPPQPRAPRPQRGTLAPTWMSSSLAAKRVMMTFSPSETRVREMPRRPLARSWLSAGRIFTRQPRMVFTRLKEGCSGPKNRFRASFDTSMMLAPVSPGAAGPRFRGRHLGRSTLPRGRVLALRHRASQQPYLPRRFSVSARGLAHN